MFKLAVLFAVVAVAVAKPSIVYSPLAYDSVAVNAVPSRYTAPSVYNVAPVARVAPVAPIAPVAPYAPVAPVVTSPYRYVQNYYEQPGYVGVPFQPQVYSGAVPYFAGSPYHSLLKRSSDEKKN